MSTATDTPVTLEAYAVAVKLPGDKPRSPRSYLGYKGQAHRLRIYRNYYTKDEADKIAAEVTANNPGYTATAVRQPDADSFLTSVRANKQK